jgi:hypothetical protein
MRKYLPAALAFVAFVALGTVPALAWSTYQADPPVRSSRLYNYVPENMYDSATPWFQAGPRVGGYDPTPYTGTQQDDREKGLGYPY